MTQVLKASEITKDQFGFWRNHPVTKIILQYMKDKSEAIESNMLIGWKSGSMKLVDEQVWRGHHQSLVMMQNLSWADVMDFYGVEMPEALESDSQEGQIESADAAEDDE